MVGSLSAGLLLADEAGAHLPSVDDFLPPEILFQGTPFAINRIILIRIVATIVLLVVLGVTAKRAKLIPGRWQGVVEYGLDFVRDKVVYDVMGNGVIPDRLHHPGRHEILRVESFDGDVKAVQSFLNEHDAGYIAEVTPEQPIIVEALGNKACVYVTKIVQCELGDILRLLETK